LSLPAIANHVLGSDITYKKVDSLQFEITLTVYRACGASAFSSKQEITLQCGSTSLTDSISRYAIQEVNLTCDTATNICTPQNSASGSSNGLERHIYKDTFDFTSSPFNSLASCSGMLRVSFSQCCRTYAGNGASSNHYNYAQFNLQAANASPIITSDPSYKVCVNQPVLYNIGAIDTVDYDSISYSWTAPLTSRGWALSYPGTIYPFLPWDVYDPRPGGGSPFPSASPPIGLYLDPKTGDVIFTPTSSQVSVYVHEIKEWHLDSTGTRVHVGTIRREMTYKSDSCASNNPPIVNGPFSYNVCEGNELCFNITTSDRVFTPPPPASAPAPDTVLLSWNEGIPGASFTILDTAARLKTGRFCWTPDYASASDLPYSFRVAVKDGQCTSGGRSSRGFRIRVKKRAYTTPTISKVSNTTYSVNSVVDSNSIVWTANYAWLLSDSSQNSILDSLTGKFKSTGFYVSNLSTDTLYLNRNQTYIIKHTINNSPLNCPSIYFDTIKVDSLLETLIDYPADTTICAGSDLTLNTSTVFAQGPVSFQWYKNDTTLLVGDTFASLTFTYTDRLGDNTYSVVVSDSSGQHNLDKVRIRSLDNFKQNFNRVYSACFGASITLVLDSLYYNLQWDKPVDTSYIYTAQNNRSISLTYQDSFLCLYNDSIDFNFNSLPVSELTDSVTCGFEIELDPGEHSFYRWSNLLYTRKVTVTNSGSYSVQLIDSNGCSSRDTVDITIHKARISLGSDTTVCTDSIILTSSAIGGYLWNTMDTTISVKLFTSGLYWLQVTDSNGCKPRDSINVNVYSAPTLDLGKDTGFCTKSFTLSAPLNYSYLWNTGATSASVTYYSTSGTYWVTITDTNSCHATDTINVGLYPPATVTLGNDTAFCGDSLLLTVAPGNSYSWSLGDTVNSSVVYSSGDQWVQLTDSNGCLASDTINVTLFSPIRESLGNDTALCGDSLLLTLAPGNNYTWSTGDTLPFKFIDASGEYWVQITDSNGCSASDTVNVTLLQNTNVPILTKSGSIITSNQSGTHKWFKNSAVISGQSQNTLTISGSGDYTAIYIDSDGCETDTSNSITRTLGIKKLSNSSLKIYPNPTNGKVTIDLDGLGTLKSIKLYDNQGRLVENVRQLNGTQALLEWTARGGILWIVVETNIGIYRAEVVGVR
jgi:hypothetical protein